MEKISSYDKEKIRSQRISYNYKNNQYNNNVEIQRIYDFYILKFNKNPLQYKLTPNRKLKLKQRLKDAGVEMLKKAINNTSQSAFHRGDNDRGWQADLDFIIRNYEQVERLSSLQIKKYIADNGEVFDNTKDVDDYNKYLKDERRENERLKEQKR